MNRVHHWLCSSSAWKRIVQRELVPWAMEKVPPGARVLEVGPGYGFATEAICGRVEHLTCVEIDPRLAEALARRMAARNVSVMCEDATSLSFNENTFDAVVCFTMLHHIPSPTLQDRMLAEIVRALRPGGVFVGTDSLPTWRLQLLHLFDTMVIVDPQDFEKRLGAAGMVAVEIDVQAGNSRFRFRAQKPEAAAVRFASCLRAQLAHDGTIAPVKTTQ